jgi:NAD(P)-dependent dehydrogenase (short-subunit alcohol dehydrogenase family)
MDRSPFAGQVAIVTGGAGGIGGALTQALLDAGATVVCADRKTPPRSPAAGLHTVMLDVTRPADVKRVFGDVVQSNGRIDLLVNVAYATDLEAYLRAQRIERICCSGVSTQAVVQATVRDGHDRDYAMVVLEDCCAAHSPEEHRNSIGSLGRFCQVTSSEQVDFSA